MKTTRSLLAITLSGLLTLVSVVGCSDSDPVSPSGQGLLSGDALTTCRTVIDHPEAPAGLVDVTWAGWTKTFWPYTGTNFSGVGQDPINLVFVGASPVQIRAALLSLDGDRSAYGVPDVFPLNATWSEAIGDAQTAYAQGKGWTGTVVQLQLGAYESLRIHIRLIESGRGRRSHDVDGNSSHSPAHWGGDSWRPGARRSWTIANAHFDLRIPGTPEHQVISWELAEYIVAVDLMRSGLLNPSSLPPQQTDMINQAPDFREIPDYIFNAMPDELKELAGLPTGETDAPVPLPNDGRATILDIGCKIPVKRETTTQTFTVQFDQTVPKPFCSDGPLDYVYLLGPLNLTKTATVGRSGIYRYTMSISGQLTAVYVDVTQDPPVPVGDPFVADVLDTQSGFLGNRVDWLMSSRKRAAPQPDGVESLVETLLVSSSFRWNSFHSETQCIDDALSSGYVQAATK